MLTWHLFTNDPTVLFEQSEQTVLLQTQCSISEPVDKFLKHALLHSVTVFSHVSLYFNAGHLIHVLRAKTTLPNTAQYDRQYYNKHDWEYAMPSIPANELKTRGITAIEQALAENTEAIVSVRGKDKYVVMSFEQYSHLRTCELEAAIHETRKVLAEGRFITESPAAHLKRLEAME